MGRGGPTHSHACVRKLTHKTIGKEGGRTDHCVTTQRLAPLALKPLSHPYKWL